MEKKRKTLQSSDVPIETAPATGSIKQKAEKTLPDPQEKDKDQNYPNKPHMLFR